MYTESIYFVPFHNEPLEWQMTISAACSHSGMYQHLTDMLHKFYCLNLYTKVKKVTSMLVTDVGNELCWWQLSDIGDGFAHFGSLYFYISIGHQNVKDVTYIKIHSPTSTNRHQHCHQHYCRHKKYPTDIFSRDS